MTKMRDIRNLFEARDWLVNKYGGEIIEPYIEQINTNYLGRTVGFIYRKNDVYFFMRFRRNVMSFNNHYPQFAQGGIGFGCNRSEIERQIAGITLKSGTTIRPVWCMFVRPDNHVYICNPAELKEFVRRFNTAKSYFRKPDVPDEDEDVLNIPFRLTFNFSRWVLGIQTQSDYDWQSIRCLTSRDLRGQKSDKRTAGLDEFKDG